MQNKNNDYGNRKFSYSIRALAGVYLLYLTYDAVTGAGEKTGPVLLFALLFAVCGVLLIVNGTMGLSRLEKQSREALRKQQEAEAQEVATQKEAEPQQRRRPERNKGRLRFSELFVNCMYFSICL